MPPETTRAGHWRFLSLTLLLCAWMLLFPHVGEHWIMHILLQLFLINFVVVTLWANPRWGRMRLVLIGLWFVSALGAATVFLTKDDAAHPVAQTIEIACMLPLLALLAWGILHFIFRHRRLDADGVFATVAVYLLIALIFAQLYSTLLLWNPASFNLPAELSQHSGRQAQASLVYFSMITLATVGYGDILPVSETARTLAVIEATVGQFYVAVIVAIFVGMYAAQRRGPESR